MARTVEAVYESGILRPLEPLELAENEHVMVTLSQKEREETKDDKPGKPDPYRTREMAWLSQHRKEYEGEYVALDGDRLVAHHKDGHEVYRLADAAGVANPLVTYIHLPDDPPTFGFVMCPTP